MNEEMLMRYSRQIALPQLDVAGQRKLLAARVLLLGAGGLGQPAALYLAAAGVGHITLIDPDKAELSNLHRQIALDSDRLGESKSVLTAEAMRKLNPQTEIVVHERQLSETELTEMLASMDLALAATDTFASRFALSRAALAATTPVLSAAVIRAEGQIILLPHDRVGPCYGCLYPPQVSGTAAQEEEESCALNGVLGPMAGMMGCMQALEAVKYLADMGQVLTAKLLLVDGMAGAFRQLQLRRDPDCELCGSEQTA